MSDIGEIVKRRVRGLDIARQLEASISWVYIMTNESMPGIVKIGITRGDVNDRARALSSSTSSPAPFQLFYAKKCICGPDIEKIMFRRMAWMRVSPNREFFNCSPRQAQSNLWCAEKEVESLIGNRELNKFLDQIQSDELYATAGVGAIPVVCPALAGIFGEVAQ